MRICKTCKGEKPLSEFYKGKCWKDGYDIYCKDCARTRKRENDHNPKGNRAKKRLLTDTEFWCSKCKKFKAISEYYTDGGRSPLGYSSYCKECDNNRHHNDNHNAKMKENYHTAMLNPDYILSERKRKLDVWRRLKDTPKWRVSKSRKEHIRRERIKNTENNLTQDDIKFLINFQENKCPSCSREFSEILKYEIDHTLPVSLGGGLTLKNVQLLCKTCNCSKGNKMILYRKSFDTLMEAPHG